MSCHLLAPTRLEDVFALVAPRLSDLSEALLNGRAGEDDWPLDADWAAWLSSMAPLECEECERSGLHRAEGLACSSAMPDSLKSLCDAVLAASTALGRHKAGRGCSCSSTCPWRQSAEKAEQVVALVEALRGDLQCDMGRVRRIVDVGCGKGHLISALQRALDLPALGLDADAALLHTASSTYPNVAFEARDVVACGLPIEPGDLIVGLHPCGALGEAIARAVADASARGVAPTLLMVPCCWHKQGAPIREPLSAAAHALRLQLQPGALKKACMALDSSASVPSRRARHELRELLRARGVDTLELAQRREMDGIQYAGQRASGSASAGARMRSCARAYAAWRARAVQATRHPCVYTAWDGVCVHAAWHGMVCSCVRAALPRLRHHVTAPSRDCAIMRLRHHATAPCNAGPEKRAVGCRPSLQKRCDVAGCRQQPMQSWQRRQRGRRGRLR